MLPGTRATTATVEPDTSTPSTSPLSKCHPTMVLQVPLSGSSPIQQGHRTRQSQTSSNRPSRWYAISASRPRFLLKRGQTTLLSVLQEVGDRWSVKGKPSSVALLAACQVAALSLWFSASAVVPSLIRERLLTAGEAPWFTSLVQL